jgi:hypothetical protein
LGVEDARAAARRLLVGDQVGAESAPAKKRPFPEIAAQR